MLRTLLWVMVFSVGLSGCAANHYDTFLAKNPDSWVDWPPPTGAGMHEVLAGLYAPPTGRYQRSIRKLDVIRLDGATPVKLTDPEIQAALGGDADGAFAIIAIQGCTSVEGTRSYRGEKVAWFLFPDGVLHAMDAYSYVDHCSVGNHFNPASKVHAGLEKVTVDWMAAKFPESMRHSTQFYSKGIAYVSKGRLEDAKLSLAEGDKTMDVGLNGRGGNRQESLRKVRTLQLSDEERLRRDLVLAIANAEDSSE